MALKLKKITLKNGIEIEEPYFKVTLVSYNDEYKEISGEGIECLINKKKVLIGNEKLLTKNSASVLNLLLKHYFFIYLY